MGDLDPGRRHTFVMVEPPPSSYAGHVGDEAVVVDRTADSVYVLFGNGIRECYPPRQFDLLFRATVA